MNLEDGLKVSELSPLKTYLDPVGTPRDVQDPATAPAVQETGSGGGVPGGDEVKVSEEYVKAVLVKDADKVVERFKDRLENGSLPEFRPVEQVREVADAVLARIQEKLAEYAGEDDGAGRDVKIKELFKELGGALEDAFKKSFKLLKKVGVLHDQGNRSLEEIQKQLQEGLDRLSEAGDGQDGSVDLVSFQGSAEVENAARRSFELEITTQEGDVVTLQVESEARQASSLDVTAEPGSLTIHKESSTFLSQNLTFEVNGDLNQEEQAAIQDLVSRTADLSNTFYGGNLGEAFRQAQTLQIDPEQIAGLSFDLEQNFEYKVAASYREVAALADATESTGPAGPAEPAAADGPVSADRFRALSRFLNQARSLSLSPSLAGLFQDVPSLVQELLAGALEAHPEHQDADPSGSGLDSQGLNTLLGSGSPVETAVPTAAPTAPESGSLL